MATTRDVREAMYAAANHNDLDSQVAYFASDATYRIAAWDVDLTSRAAIRQRCTRSWTRRPTGSSGSWGRSPRATMSVSSTSTSRPVPSAFPACRRRVRGSPPAIPGNGAGQERAVVGDLDEGVFLQAQGQHPRHAPVDDPPALRGAGRGGDDGLMLTVDQHQFPLAAHRAVHRAHLDDACVAVEGGVGDQQHPVLDGGKVRTLPEWRVDEQRTGEPTEDLVGDRAVVVRVIPVGAGWMLGRDLV